VGGRCRPVGGLDSDKVAMSSGGGTQASRGGEVSNFEHKRTLFKMNNTIFALTSGRLMLQQRAQTGAGGRPEPLLSSL